MIQMYDNSEMRPETTNVKNNNNNEALPTASLRLLAPPLRLVSAAMWKVMQQRDAMHYGKLEEFVTSVSETVPGLLSYRHQAKLCVGLRARLILEQLHVAQSPDCELILPQLERLRAPVLPNNKRMRTDQKVEMAVKNFHTLVQTLLEKPAEREQFFKEEFDSQYGPQFDSALEKLLWEFLTRLDQLLPVPDLAQTVSWLTAAPAVLEECARSASQPQLLKTLLQHEKCLGHLDSAAYFPSSIGESILSSLSLPLSGKVRDSNESGATPTPNLIPSPTASTQRSNKKQARDSVSYIPPVIGSISTADILHEASTNQNVESRSEKESDEVDTESCMYTRVKSRSCEKSKHCVGKVLVNQTPTLTSGEAEEEDEFQISPVRRSSRKNSAKDKQDTRNGDKMLDLGQKRKRKASQRNPQETNPQEDEGLRTAFASCVKRQLRVVIPRLEIKASAQTVDTSSDEDQTTASPRKPATEGVCAVICVDAGKRKRKLSLSETPEKNLSINIIKQVCAGSPCIPTLTPLRMENSDTASSVTHSTDDLIVDSEDEATEKIKGRLFTKRYCKTKSDTYIPTLHEFWTPGFFRRDYVSPGYGCR
ncbi:TERF1-interacting nuclear factor 2 isoform X1 [Tachysurus fulvidraco]|uniref:TERF1-interacting nuclear factor 2 isoform X1 n=2 Tax=Tachysurus fulvidraco TaxID=1234273 RepID=UPI001FEF01C4|nr:TERF1-interacting nuclear factor 2 isoform X1 [Tachysurus fulvidraco]